MADVTCPQCEGKKGPFPVFLNRGDSGHSVEQRMCSRCKGAGTISEDAHKMVVGGRRIRDTRVAFDLSLTQASTILGLSVPILSAIENGRERADHDALVKRLTPKIDSVQLKLNGGPYCYHVDEGRYCGRAEPWIGHGYFHEFKGAPQ